jgi:hypothetical protein
MTAATFNATRTRFGAWFDDDPAKFGVLLLKAADLAAAMRDHDTIADMLADPDCIEADFTNYTRKTGLTATAVIDDTTDLETFYLPNQTWAAAGGTLDNAIVAAIVFYEHTASDAGRRPVASLALSETTSGSDLTIKFAENGIYVSSDETA